MVVVVVAAENVPDHAKAMQKHDVYLNQKAGPVCWLGCLLVSSSIKDGVEVWYSLALCSRLE